MKHCNHCGVALEDDARFCESCGQQQEVPAGVAEEEAEPVAKSGSALPWIAIIVLSIVLLIGVVVFAFVMMGSDSGSDSDDDTVSTMSVPATTTQTTVQTTTLPTTPVTTIPPDNNNVVVPSNRGTATQMYVNTPSGVHMRTGPDTNYPSVCVAPDTVGITVYEGTRQGDWVYAAYANETGWVSSQYLTYYQPAGGMISESNPYYMTCNEGDGINLRSGPGTNYSRICGVPYGHTVKVHGYSGDDWMYVYYPKAGKYGWVHRAYFKY